jgi:hypothetical protein
VRLFGLADEKAVEEPGARFGARRWPSRH